MTTWPFGTMRPLAYQFIMADPPWEFLSWSESGNKEKSPQGQYDCMSLDDIKALPVGHLAGGDCLLWLWATHPMIRQQLEVVDAWGFTFVTSGVWVKRTRNGKLAFGTGYRLRCASEPFFICTNGNPATVKNIRTVIEGPIRQHSRKPEEAYAAAEAMCPRVLKRADLFSRQVRPGWDAWGNEIHKFEAVA